MTDDMRTEITAIGVRLKHIEDSLKTASEDRKITASVIDQDRRLLNNSMESIKERLIILEQKVESSSDLGHRVKHNEEDSIAREAYKEGVKDTTEDLKANLRIWIGLPAFIITVATILDVIGFIG